MRKHDWEYVCRGLAQIVDDAIVGGVLIPDRLRNLLLGECEPDEDEPGIEPVPPGEGATMSSEEYEQLLTNSMRPVDVTPNADGFPEKFAAAVSSSVRPIEREACGPAMWAKQRKCCPDCTHPRTGVCEGCGGIGSTRPVTLDLKDCPHCGAILHGSERACEFCGGSQRPAEPEGE